MNSLCSFPAVSRKARFRGIRGVTLVELMISAVLFSAVSLATLAALINAYRVASLVRYRDQARFVLASTCDQFLRAAQTDASGPRPFFAVTEVSGVPTPSGVGMSWYTDKQIFVITPSTATADGQALHDICIQGGATGLVFPLATATQAPVTATLTRLVSAVDPTTGNSVTGNPTPTTAGYLLRGDFTISFTFQGRLYTESETVLRSAR